MATTWRQAWPATRLRRPEPGLAGNTTLLGIDGSAVADLELLASAPIGKGRRAVPAALGGLPAGHDGLVVVGVVAGKVAYVSSSLAGGDLAGAASLSPTEAFRRAAASAGRSVGAVTRLGEADGWTVLRADGFASPQRVRLVALPIPGAGAVPAYEAIVLDGAAVEPLGVSVFVDAEAAPSCFRRVSSTTRASRPGRSSRRRLPSTTPRPTRASSGAGRPGPAVTGSSTRSSPGPEWDVNSGAGSSFTTDGNNAKGVHNWFSNNPFTVGTETATSRPDATTSTGGRTSGSSSGATLTRRSPRPSGTTSTPRGRTCSPGTTACTTGPTISASRRRPSTCRRTTSASVGSGTTTSRATPRPEASRVVQPRASRRGTTPTRSPRRTAGADHEHVPVAADRRGLLCPCVDGDFDMSVIGHEYTHAISNRMVAGPNTGLSGSHGGAMGESWSDLAAMEILNEYGFVPSPTRTGSRSTLRHGRQAGRHPQLRDECQPAELLERRLRLRLQPSDVPC